MVGTVDKTRCRYDRYSIDKPLSAAKPLKARRPKDVGDLPIHIVNRELADFTEAFEVAVSAFRDRVIANMEEVQAKLNKKRAAAKGDESVLPTLRDLLLTLRTLKARPEKGRRRDLKQFETITEELAKLLEKWEKG